MEKELSKIETIKKTLSEMEASITGSKEEGKVEDRVNDKISQVAEKGRNFIDHAENKVNEVVAKISEKKESYGFNNEEKKKKMSRCFFTSIISFLALITFMKMRKHSQKKED